MKSLKMGLSDPPCDELMDFGQEYYIYKAEVSSGHHLKRNASFLLKLLSFLL